MRDSLLGLPVKDYDLEVYGLPSSILRALLEQQGKISAVGEQFAVYKLRPQADASAEIDVSLPRRESKRGYGHRGFLIEGDPWMSFQDAVSRRDFTINAILQDPLTRTIIDPCQGVSDLKSKKLRAVNSRTFREDSLRVLRAAQLSARYGLTISAETILLCQQTSLKDIPRERIYAEFEKLLLLAPRPSVGLSYFSTLGITTQIFPMLWDLYSSPMNNSLYSKDSLWNYTLKSIDKGKTLVKQLSEPEQLSVLISVLGIRLALPRFLELLDRLGIYSRRGYKLREQIISLTTLHLLPYKLFFQPGREKVENGVFLRLEKLVDLKLMSYLLRSLHLDHSNEFSSWLDEKLKILDSIKNDPCLKPKGRSLLKAGIPPGPHMKSLLNQVRELAIENRISSLDQAQQAASALYKRKSKAIES